MLILAPKLLTCLSDQKLEVLDQKLELFLSLHVYHVPGIYKYLASCIYLSADLLEDPKGRVKSMKMIAASRRKDFKFAEMNLKVFPMDSSCILV